jgi:hypothetical protein
VNSAVTGPSRRGRPGRGGCRRRTSSRPWPRPRLFAESPAGQEISQQELFATFQRQAPASVQNSGYPGAFPAWAARHGYTQWTTLQPDSRFWEFQLIEGSWLAALSAGLIGATVWLVRRRGA